MQQAASPTVRFARELRALLRAPYALIHLETHEEERALELICQIGTREKRPVWDWSVTSGFGDEPAGDLDQAFAQIAATVECGIFVFKDANALLDNVVLRRRLRELESLCARTGKALIFLGPTALNYPEFAKELTRVVMPLPDRDIIGKQCLAVFEPEHFPEIDREDLVSGAMGLTQREAQRAFVRVRGQLEEARARNVALDVQASILQEKQRLIGQSEVLEFHPLSEGMEDVGGLSALKGWLGERSRAFSQEARAYGLPAPKGLLLIGVQGCGKSLTAKVVGRFWGLPLLRLDMGAVFDGSRAPEEALRHALKTCDALAPCVLWMDEIEKGFAASGEEGRSARVLGSLLTWQQEKTTPVFVVATANRVDALPPELLRKGRFDEIFFIDLPDVHERKDILRIHLERRGRRLAETLLDEISARCEYFSGAELEQVVVSAMYTAFADGREIENDDLIYATQETIPLYRTYEEQIKALREWAHGRARPASRERKMLDFFRPV
ncbi:MAG: AAA family ATPase [Bradymonadaceae bacterium]|nr:AAA family ATPase [Lujinxingiaceae bacterium]